MQNRSLFLFSFVAITVLHGYILEKIKIKDQMIAVKPQPKVSPIIQLRHVVIKKTKPLPKVEPVKEEIQPKPPKPIVKKIKKKIRVIKKKIIKKVLKKKRTVKKVIQKPISKKIPVVKSMPIKKKLSKEKIQKSVPLLQSSSPKQKIAKNNYLAKVRSIIEHKKKYPRSAKRLRQQGVVTIGFTIYKDGHIEDVKLLKKSSYTKLNHAAIKILKRIGTFPPIPKELEESSLSLTVPIRYKILN